MTQMKSVKNMRIALVGGGGFIGHNLALSLDKMGAHVEIVDSLQVNNLYSLGQNVKNPDDRDFYHNMLNERLDLLRIAGIPLHLQDARDYHALCRILTEIKPDVIIQLAAVSHANKSNKDPYSTFDHSLRTLENALDGCRDTLKHFIFFSSSMVYGHFADTAVAEDAVCNPLGIYGALKFAGEKIVIAYNQVFDLPYTIIRPSALYGERCISRRVGQIFLENALRGKDITVHGDGTDALDFTYIQDLIQGVVKTLEHPAAENETFNITRGEGRKIKDMAEIVRANFPNIKIDYEPKDALTPDRGTLSIDKARDLIGYDPQYDLDKGYQQYIEWYKGFNNRQKQKDAA